MKHFFYPVLIAFIFMISISSGCKKAGGKQENFTNSIVLIFDTVKTNYDTLSYWGGSEMITFAPVLTFKSEKEGEYISPIMKIEKDTVVINTGSEYLFIHYRYNPISGLDFIAKPGDTIRLDERCKTPFLTMLNREVKDYDINYDFHKRNRYSSLSDYNVEDFCNNPSLLYVMKKKAWGKYGKIMIDKLVEELKNEDIWLDSLYNNKLLSECEYGIYESRNRYKLMGLELENKEVSALKEYLEVYNDSTFRHDAMGFYSAFYWKCLNTYIQKSFTPSFDYTWLFDWLEHTEMNLGALSVRAKLACLDKIIATCSVAKGQEYYNKFIEGINDTTLLSNLDRKYRHLFDKSINSSDDIELLDFSENRLSLGSILEKYKGKIIYIDFWANWCVPCLREMLPSEQLREKYAGKDVIFVYLSFDNKINVWKKATSTAGLNGVRDNYLILNAKTSAVLKELDVKTLPRYVVYGRDGKIVNRDAPRPSERSVEDMFDELLE